MYPPVSECDVIVTCQTPSAELKEGRVAGGGDYPKAAFFDVRKGPRTAGPLGSDNYKIRIVFGVFHRGCASPSWVTEKGVK